MQQLTDSEKAELIRILSDGSPLTDQWRHRLFSDAVRASPVGKEYRLVYEGKLTREEVLAQTPAAPWQLERSFCAERPHGDGWRNLLVWGDNLLALRELLADQQGPNRLGTREKIKLIYIDPPFATRQDFMKDKEKAYQDKVLGARFIEFLRRRLILLREVLAADGSIYVHLDWKKGHYMKAVLDEVFGEVNFMNNVVWCYKTRTFAKTYWNRKHDDILAYAKNFGEHVFNWDDGRVMEAYSAGSIKKFKLKDEVGWYRLCGRGIAGSPIRSAKDVDPKWERTHPHLVVRNYLGEGFAPSDYWNIEIVNQAAKERADYPTQKPERLLERIIAASSNEGDVVLDCFSGSGTTAAVAEKLRRRWIAMDCGKLAIYTTQKRLVSLTTTIGAAKKDERVEPERVEDWGEHLKGASGVLLITEKARNGECEVTLELLHDLAALTNKHHLLKKGAALSLVCPEEKLRIPEDQLREPEDGPGTKRINVGGIEFRLSAIAPKDKPEKEQALPAKEFALYRAGIYDMAAIKGLPWRDYQPFVLKLFGVREHPHSRYGFALDGYNGTHSTLVWNYPDHPVLTLDYGYVDDLHRTLRGKSGERFYVIAPVVAMAFAEDEVMLDETTYVFLKVPMSVLLRLIERKEPAALKQPAKEKDVNEVIDAVGFDFISQPQVVWKTKHERRKDGLFTQSEYVMEIAEFRAQTLATDPEDFQNFETFSMAMLDLDYDGDVFRLSRVFWGEDLLNAAGGLEKAERLELRIAEADFNGKQMMVILCDRYGNEKSLLLAKGDFEGQPRRAKQVATVKKGRKAK